MLADGDIGAGLRLLNEWMEPYPWWYWFLLIAGNIPVYMGMIYVVFFSREGFREYCRAFIDMYRNDTPYGCMTQLVVASRIIFWFCLCVAAVLVQHHLLWKTLWGDG